MPDEPPLTTAEDVAATIEHPSRLARFVAARLDPKTDVIGGFAAGMAWVAICVTGTRIARETRALTPDAQDEERAGGA
jgi:hypothetical protein